MYRRDIFLQRFRFRRIREFGQGEAEVTISAAAKPVGTFVEDTQINTLPNSNLFERIGRSKREKKCNNSNDQTCANDLNNNPDCRWEVLNSTSDLVYSDVGFYASGPDFCDPVEVYMEWHELDIDPLSVMSTITVNILNYVGCLGRIFRNPGADIVERIYDGLVACPVQSTSTLLQTLRQIANIPYTEEQNLGYLQTGANGTAHVSAPAFPETECFWETPTEDAGNIQDTWKGKTAQAELRQTITELGWATWAGVRGCDCSPDSIGPLSAADLKYVRLSQLAGCEIQAEIQLKNNDLKSFSAARRNVRVFFDTDESTVTGDQVAPYCGADYYVDFLFVPVPGGSNPGVDVYRSAAEYTGPQFWTPVTPYAIYDLDVRSCAMTFAVNLLEIGNPPPGTNLRAWCVTIDHTGFMYLPSHVLDVMPSGGGCTAPLSILLEAEEVCPTVVSVDAAALEYGNKSATIHVGFSEIVLPVDASDVTISPAVPFTVSMSSNQKFLNIHPASSFPPGRYDITLAGSISDCAGNGLADETGVCGTGTAFEVCVPEINLIVSDDAETPKRAFEIGEDIYISGENLQALPFEITVYVTPASILELAHSLSPIPIPIIDETAGGQFPGPDTFNPTNSTTIQHYSLGTTNTAGEYTVIVDMNQDGLFQLNSDLTLNPCLPAFTVGCDGGGSLRGGEDCDPCSDVIGARFAYWPLDEAYALSGAKDFESDQDGTYSGSPVSTFGKKGNGLHFDGVDDYVVVEGSPVLTIGADEEFSISGWLLPGATAPVKTIIDSRGNGTGFRLALVSGKLNLELADGSGVGSYSSTALVPAGVWTHFLVSVDRSAPNALKIYLNGVFDSTHDASSKNGSLATALDFWIGGHHTNGSAHFLGVLDELALWDEPLTFAEQYRLFQADELGLPCPIDPVVGLDAPQVASVSVSPGARMLGKPSSPFVETLRFSVALPGRCPVKLGLYNASGRRIATILDDVLETGAHELSWNARTGASDLLASGVYFLRLEALGRSETEKVVLVR